MVEQAESFEDQLLDILPKLHATSIMLTRDRTAAADLLQDSLVLALTGKAHYVPGTNLSAWMYRVMRNRFISLVRRRRSPTVPLDDPAAMAVGVAGNQEDHMAHLELEGEMAALPASQREALVLVGAAGQSYEEAAKVIGCSVGTVKSRVSRARETLRCRLLVDAPSAGRRAVATPAQRANARRRGTAIGSRVSQAAWRGEETRSATVAR